MKSTTIRLISLCISMLLANSAFADCHDLLNYEAGKLRTSESIDFCEQFEGKVLLVVNTASQCGYTPQFEGLEAMHQEYGDKLAIIGFPSDDFNQEYSDQEKIGDVCYLNYGVTFTMLEPSSVKGSKANEFFKKLATKTGEQPAWNFNKYLISADGGQVQYFPASVAPDDARLVMAVEGALAKVQ